VDCDNKHAIPLVTDLSRSRNQGSRQCNIEFSFPFTLSCNMYKRAPFHQRGDNAISREFHPNKNQEDTSVRDQSRKPTGGWITGPAQSVNAGQAHHA
jgi:hypothetical protein